MLNCSYLLITIILSSTMLANSIYAADFNIKIRKTDINELKQQLMPTFDQNIQILNDLLLCLEQGKETDVCLEPFTMNSENMNEDEYKERQEQIKQEIKQKINDNKIEQEQIVFELKKLLAEAEKVRQCLNLGQTANELKDCVIQP